MVSSWGGAPACPWLLATTTTCHQLRAQAAPPGTLTRHYSLHQGDRVVWLGMEARDRPPPPARTLIASVPFIQLALLIQ